MALSTRYAVEVMQKLEERKVPCAVFISMDYDNYRCCKLNTDLFRSQIERNPSMLMGIYTTKCKQSWIEEDFQYMGIK